MNYEVKKKDTATALKQLMDENMQKTPLSILIWSDAPWIFFGHRIRPG